MPRIAHTSDLLARVRTAIAAELPAPAEQRAAVAEVERLVDEVNVRGKSTVSRAEVLALAARDAVAGARVARAFELITGKHIDIAPPLGPLASRLPEDWRAALANEIAKPYFQDLEKFVAAERAHFPVEPPVDDVFAALRATPLANVKCVLLGQDPYPTPGNANGLSFSVRPGQAIPASLKNMLQTASADVGTSMPNNGDLTPWAKQGVLLINTVLTVRAGAPDSHAGHGWEQFTQAILDKVNAAPRRVAFLLLGRQAQQVAAGVDTVRHVVIQAPHPSPMNPGNPFGKTHVFSEVNKALVDGGRAPVDWQLPNV